MTNCRLPYRTAGLLAAAAVACSILLSSTPAGAAEIVYLPGQDRAGAAQTLGLDPSLAVLVWELPGGLLVADRLAPAGAGRFGPPLRPAFAAGEWFVVDTRQRGARDPGETWNAARLAEFGRVHLEDGRFLVVEVPAERLEDFAACPLERQRIPFDPPPTRWEGYAAAVKAALGEGTGPGNAGLGGGNRTPGAGLSGGTWPGGADQSLDAPRAGGSPAGSPPGRMERSTITDFLAEGNEASFQQRLQEISGAAEFVYGGGPYTVHTRYYNTTSKTLVADYLAETLAGYGYAVEFQPFTVGSTTCRNVVATLTGTTAPEEYVVVGGHYDSTSPQPSTLAPGTEDNGSGTSLVMEIARMAAGHSFQRSVQFVLFDSEEQGLNGSEHFVEEAVGAGQVIVSAITADMVTWYSSHYGVIIEGETEWEALMSVMEASVADYTGLSSRKDYYSWGSDHVPFQQAGIPAFLAIDWDWSGYPYYHGTGDTWAHVQATAHIGHEITQACAATLAEVAGLLAPAATTGAALTCLPPSGTVPFATQMTASLSNLLADQSRRIAGRIHVRLAGGNWFPNWRAGYTNVAAGEAYVTTWSQALPAMGALIGANTFTLVAEDVTPSPFNQPPYPPAGDTDSAACTVTGIAP